MNVQVREKKKLSADRISMHFQSTHMQESHAFYERFIVVTATTLYCFAVRGFFFVQYQNVYNIYFWCCISICGSNRRSLNNSCHLLCSYKILKKTTYQTIPKKHKKQEKNGFKGERTERGGLVFAYGHDLKSRCNASYSLHLENSFVVGTTVSRRSMCLVTGLWASISKIPNIYSSTPYNI